MRSRSLRCLRSAGFALVCSVLCACDGGPDRDWTAHPPIVELDGATEIWALSDVHGDETALLKLLSAAGLANTSGSTPVWSGGKAVLVVIGDLIDKGPDAVAVVRSIIALQASAPATGGQVIVTMGNHEADFLAAPANSKAQASDGIDGQLTQAGLSLTTTAAGQDDVGQLLFNLPFAARVDDWFFAHAGNTQGRTLTQLASYLQGGVAASGFANPVLSANDSILENKLSGTVFWEQGGAPEATLTTWAQALNANHIVMGHDPGSVTFADGVARKSDELLQRYGRIFLIDTGMSVDVDNTGGALLHIPDPTDATQAQVVTPDGKRKALVAK